MCADRDGDRESRTSAIFCKSATSTRMGPLIVTDEALQALLGRECM